MASFDFEASLTEPDQLLFTVIFNHTEYSLDLSLDPKKFQFEFDGDETQTIKFRMANKLPNSTVVDSLGNFIKNPMIKISNIQLEGFNIDYWIQKNNVYRIDNRTESFCEYMGCNGEVEFTIQAPSWQWLLENIS